MEFEGSQLYCVKITCKILTRHFCKTNNNFLFQEFLTSLNEFRTSLPSRYSHLTQPSESQVRGQVQLAGRRHSDLLARAQRLQERLRGVGDTRRLYGEAVDKAGRWLKEVGY